MLRTITVLAAAAISGLALPGGPAPALTGTSPGPAAVLLAPRAPSPPTPIYRCFQVSAPYRSAPSTATGTCAAGYVMARLSVRTAQVITVSSTSQASTSAVFTGFTRIRGAWTRTWGPWPARIGYSGFASPGAKREGDGATPQGSYGFQFMFGVRANPGVRYPWQAAHSYDYWDDDPASPRYNLWTDTRSASAGVNPEPMYNVPAYNYGAVINYNRARTPGLGSAIFLHVGSGSSPTAGCVSLPVNRLLPILRWLAPGASPVIAMAVIKP